MSALNRPVLVPTATRSGRKGPDSRFVRPSDVLAALDDEQREAMVDRVARAANLSAGQQRGLAGWDDDWDEITEQERGGWRILARAVVAALTDKEQDDA